MNRSTTSTRPDSAAFYAPEQADGGRQTENASKTNMDPVNSAPIIRN